MRRFLRGGQVRESGAERGSTWDFIPRHPRRIWPDAMSGSGLVGSDTALLSGTRPQLWVGWPAELVEEGRKEAKEVRLDV